MGVHVRVSATVAGRTYHLGSAVLDTPNDPALRQVFRNVADELERYAREVLVDDGDGFVIDPAEEPFAWDDDNEATPPLDVFLRHYYDDDNAWWRLGSGHHLNLFLEAVERMQAAEEEVARGKRSRTAL